MLVHNNDAYFMLFYGYINYPKNTLLHVNLLRVHSEMRKTEILFSKVALDLGPAPPLEPWDLSAFPKI